MTIVILQEHLADSNLQRSIVLRSMYRFLARKLPILMALLLVATSYGQQPGRKVIHQVSPLYPPILKEKSIGGVVKIAAVVTPAGTVKETRMLGGNPVLAMAAERAIKLWKYAPTSNETQETVILKFDPASPYKQ